VLDLEGGLARPLPGDTFGPDIDFRESSFLANPLLPADVRAGRVAVDLCAAGEAGCEAGGAAAAAAAAPAAGGGLKLRRGMRSAELRLALAGAAAAPLLEFSAVDGAFGGFDDAAEGLKFERRMAQYASIWCCIQGSPGHIWYDLLWDQPHKDRHGRVWSGSDWKPRLGP